MTRNDKAATSPSMTFSVTKSDAYEKRMANLSHSENEAMRKTKRRHDNEINFEEGLHRELLYYAHQDLNDPRNVERLRNAIEELERLQEFLQTRDG